MDEVMKDPVGYRKNFGFCSEQQKVTGGIQEGSDVMSFAFYKNDSGFAW